MEFQCRGTEEGRLEFGPYNRARFQQFLKEHPGIRLKITAELPESRKMRKFYHGAVLPLWAFLDGKDHRDHTIIEELHEVAKLEFNAEMVTVGGKVVKVGKSTKGREALKVVVERVIDWLNDNYVVPAEALDSEKFKEWRDGVFPFGGPDDYIDYLKETGVLRSHAL